MQTPISSRSVGKGDYAIPTQRGDKLRQRLVYAFSLCRRLCSKFQRGGPCPIIQRADQDILQSGLRSLCRLRDLCHQVGNQRVHDRHLG